MNLNPLANHTTLFVVEVRELTESTDWFLFIFYTTLFVTTFQFATDKVTTMGNNSAFPTSP